MTQPDLYAILGIPRSASTEEIKQAYRRRAFATHPDQNADNPNAQAEFEAVSKAYAVLSNTALKAEYDRTGAIPGLAADTLEAQALSAINQLLGQILRVDADPLASPDLIGQMKSCMHDEIASIEKQHNILKRAKLRAEKLQARFKLKDDKANKGKENALASSLTWHLKQIAAELIPIEEGLKVLKRAYDILGQYTCAGDIPTAALYGPQGNVTTTYTWTIGGGRR